MADFSYLREDIPAYLAGVAATFCAVKLEPEFGQSLREHYEGVRPAYHLNKTHWNDIYLDRIDDELTKQWIRQSYELVLSKLPKKLREKYI